MSRPSHPLAGQTVTVDSKVVRGDVAPGAEFQVHDWWENVAGSPWYLSTTNAAYEYAKAATINETLYDDNVLYGRINGLGYLVHVSEIVGRFRSRF